LAGNWSKRQSNLKNKQLILHPHRSMSSRASVLVSSAAEQNLWVIPVVNHYSAFGLGNCVRLIALSLKSLSSVGEAA